MYTEALERASKHARDWLADVPGRRVPPRATADDLADVLGGPLPDQPSDPGDGRRPAGGRRRARA